MKKILSTKTNCPVCNSKKITFLMNGKDRVHAIKGEYTLWNCTNCLLIFLNPQPSPKILEKHYPRDYHAYNGYETGSKKEKFAIFLYKLYFSAEQNGVSAFIQKIIFLPFRHLLRGTYIKQRLKILDVGCGSGEFLYKMKKCGLDAYGVEPSKEGTDAAKKMGLNVRCGFLENQKFPSDYFDVITLNHVFEHVSDPLKTLKELGRILKKDGKLIMAFPNPDSLQFKIFREYWASLEVPRHLNIYYPKTIKYMASIGKFNIESIRYISFPYGIQASLAYVFNKNEKPLDRTWIGKSRMLYFVIFPIVYILDFLHCGDAIEVTLTPKKTIKKFKP